MNSKSKEKAKYFEETKRMENEGGLIPTPVPVPEKGWVEKVVDSVKEFFSSDNLPPEVRPPEKTEMRPQVPVNEHYSNIHGTTGGEMPNPGVMPSKSNFHISDN